MNSTDIRFFNLFQATTVVLEEGGYIEDYKVTTSANTNTNSSGNDSVTIGDKNYIIDLDNLDNDTTSLPSGTYQSGTVKQRAEMLLIIQEICSRPEITIEPIDLLGVLYAECTGNIGASGSLVTSSWPVQYNAYNCGGPFQHNKGDWEGTSYKAGKIFISSVEDASLDDSQRVLTSSQANGMKTPDGLTRPSMFFFPDAAYTTAYRLSKTYPDSQVASTTNWTKEVGDWASAQGLNSYQKNILQLNSAFAYYNGYTSAAKSWVPAFYGDVMKVHNKITSWSNQASSRANLNSILKDNLLPNLVRTLPNFATGYDYFDNYLIACNNSDWQVVQFGFVAHNGGAWIYNGLCLLAEAVGGLDTDDNLNSVEITDTTFNAIFAEAKKYIGIPYVLTSDLKGMNPPNNFCCASYVSYVFTRLGYKGITSWSAQTLYDTNVTKIKTGEQKPGDLVFFENTYNGPNQITHVGIYIGDNKMIHAGDPVHISDISTNYWQSRLYAYGRVKQ